MIDKTLEFRPFNRRRWTVHFYLTWPYIKFHIHWGICMCELNHIMNKS